MEIEGIDESISVLLEASTDGKEHPFSTVMGNCNLTTITSMMKLQSHLVALAHTLSSKSRGSLTFDVKTTTKEDEFVVEYIGTIYKLRNIDFSITVRTVLNDAIAEVAFDSEDVLSIMPTATDFNERVVFLFDFAVSAIKDWDDKVLAIEELEKKKEDEECELE
jgi:hypothetical protein